MEDNRSSRDLLADAIELTSSWLETGERPRPALITDDWGDRRVEQFEESDLQGAKESLADFLRAAAGEQRCALAYVGRVGMNEDAIIVERGTAGEHEVDVFVQRFRPKRGPLRRFKLLGEPKPVGATESLARS